MLLGILILLISLYLLFLSVEVVSHFEGSVYLSVGAFGAILSVSRILNHWPQWATDLINRFVGG